jgi:hypothetical protein
MCIIKQKYFIDNSSLNILHETKILTMSQIVSCIFGLHLVPYILVGLHSQTDTKRTVSADGRPITVPDVKFQLSFMHDEEHGNNVMQLGVLLFYSFSMFSMYLLNKTISEQTKITHFLFRSVIGLFLGVAFFYIIAVIFGAPIMQLMLQTVTWGVVQSIFVIVPLASARSFDISVWQRVYALNDSRTSFELCSSWGGIGSIIGAWLGACLIPLDWDEPWQKWPITLIHGGTFGFVIGHTCAYFRVKSLLKESGHENSFQKTFLIPKTKM